MLSYVEPGKVVFRAGDGSPITAEEMVKKLQDDDDDAVAFLRDLTDAALTVTGVRSAKRASGT